MLEMWSLRGRKFDLPVPFLTLLVTNISTLIKRIPNDIYFKVVNISVGKPLKKNRQRNFQQR